MKELRTLRHFYKPINSIAFEHAENPSYTFIRNQTGKFQTMYRVLEKTPLFDSPSVCQAAAYLRASPQRREYIVVGLRLIDAD